MNDNGGNSTGVDISKIDHLVYASPDLELGIKRLEELLGVRASPGGSHAGLGTRNALLCLGSNSYLEIIGPDSAQIDYLSPRPFGIDELTSPTLVTWAAKASSLKDLTKSAAKAGIHLGEAFDMSRQLPDGQLLSWSLTFPQLTAGKGFLPFFIDWGSTPHPSQSAAGGATLTKLMIEHPHCEKLTEDLQTLGIESHLQRAACASLIATIEGNKGPVELR